MLAFESGGSLLIRRAVHEILIGWHIECGYMGPYVLLTYLAVTLDRRMAAAPRAPRALAAGTAKTCIHQCQSPKRWLWTPSWQAGSLRHATGSPQHRGGHHFGYQPFPAGRCPDRRGASERPPRLGA